LIIFEESYIRNKHYCAFSDVVGYVKMRIVTTILFIIIFWLDGNSQTNSAFFYFGKDWHENKMTFEHRWIINGQEILFSHDTIKIKINDIGFDTISFKFWKQDTVWRKSIAKFKSDKYYNIREIPCTDYDIVSSDTSEHTKHEVRFIVKNYMENDTIAGLGGWVLTRPITTNKFTEFIEARTSGMCANTRRQIKIMQFKPGLYCLNRSMFVEGGNKLFEFAFQFIHNEKLEVIYNHKTKMYKVKIIE
jgi:hypothetical protein